MSSKSSGTDINPQPSLPIPSTNKQEKLAPLRLSHVLLPSRIASSNSSSSSSSSGNTSSNATGICPQSVSVVGPEAVRLSVEHHGHDDDDIVRLGSFSGDWQELLSKAQASDAQQQHFPAAAHNSLSLAILACSRHSSSWDAQSEAQHTSEGPKMQSRSRTADAPVSKTYSDSWHSCDADLCCCEEDDSQPPRDSHCACAALGAAAASQLQPYGMPTCLKPLVRDLSPTRQFPAARKDVQGLSSRGDGKLAGGYLSAAAVAGTDVGAVLSTRLGLCQRLSFLRDQQLILEGTGSHAAPQGSSCLMAGKAEPSALTKSSQDAEDVLLPLLHTHTLLASWGGASPVVSAAARVPRGRSSRSRDSVLPVLGASCTLGWSGEPQTGRLRLTQCPSDSTLEWWHHAGIRASEGFMQDTAATATGDGHGGKLPGRQLAGLAAPGGAKKCSRFMDDQQPDAVHSSSDVNFGLAEEGLGRVELQAALAVLEEEKATILDQLREMVDIYHSQQRELEDAEEHKATLKERCQELELQLTEAHFDAEELEGLLDAQADAALQQAAVQEFKHKQQVKALQQQVQELLALLAGVSCCDGSKAVPASCAVAQHPFIQPSAAMASTLRQGQQQQQQPSQTAAGPLTAAKQRSSSRGTKTACRDSRRGNTAGASCTGPMTAAKQRQQDCIGCAGSAPASAAASYASIYGISAAQRDQNKSRQLAHRTTGHHCKL